MASFGRTAKGSVADSGYEGYRAASKYTLTEDGDVSELALWVTIGTAAVTARGLIYADSGGAPGALIAVTPDVTIPVGSDQQVLFDFTDAVSLAAGDYWLGVGFDSAGGGSVTVWCEPSGTGSHVYRFGSTAADPFGTATTAGSAGDIDVSASYTVPAPPPPIVYDEAMVLVDLEGNARAFLEPDEVSLTRRWCAGSTLAATLDVQDPKVAEIAVASRAVQYWLEGGIRFHGKVGEPLTSDQDNVSLVAADPWDELTARTLQADETYTAEDAGQIALDSLATENGRATTRLAAGTVEATVARTITFTAGTTRADLVTQLSQLDGGFGFAIDPVAGSPGTLAELTILAGFSRGELPGVRFEYGAGTLANCVGFTEELRRPRNRVIVQGQSLADGTRPQAVAEDTASQDEYGLWEYVVSLDTTDTTVLQAHAQGELRPDPVAIYTLKPGVDAPMLFRDFDAGHVVGLAIRHGRVDVVGTARVDECTIKRSSGNEWTIDSLTLSAPAVQRVTRRPDERLYALIGSYRDRIALLERARIVGA